MFFTTGITTGYHILVGFEARSGVRLGGLVVKAPAACTRFESRMFYFVFLLRYTFKFISDIEFLVFLTFHFQPNCGFNSLFSWVGYG